MTRREIVAAFVVVAGLASFAVVGDPANGVCDAPGNEWLTAITKQADGRLTTHRWIEVRFVPLTRGAAR